MNHVATVEADTQVPVTAPAEAASIMEVIGRAARDPTVDVSKLERMMDLYERVVAQKAKASFNAALARMQPDLPAIDKRGKSNNGAYGLWEDIQGGIQPVIAKHGFALSFKTAVTPEAVTVTAILRHEDGHDDSTEIALPIDKSGSKNNVQAVGSSVSYGKRYAACALLNIRVGGEDDDGKAAGFGEAVSEEQAANIRAIIEEAHADARLFCQYFKIEAIPDLPAERYQDAVRMLEQKRRGGKR